jgi:hypothetical protein
MSEPIDKKKQDSVIPDILKELLAERKKCKTKLKTDNKINDSDIAYYEHRQQMIKSHVNEMYGNIGHSVGSLGTYIYIDEPGDNKLYVGKMMEMRHGDTIYGRKLYDDPMIKQELEPNDEIEIKI